MRAGVVVGAGRRAGRQRAWRLSGTAGYPVKATPDHEHRETSVSTRQSLAGPANEDQADAVDPAAAAAVRDGPSTGAAPPTPMGRPSHCAPTSSARSASSRPPPPTSSSDCCAPRAAANRAVRQALGDPPCPAGVLGCRCGSSSGWSCRRTVILPGMASPHVGDCFGWAGNADNPSPVLCLGGGRSVRFGVRACGGPVVPVRVRRSRPHRPADPRRSPRYRADST